MELLVSQNRNATTNISYAQVASANAPTAGGLTGVPPGGNLPLVVGNFYDIRLDASTATNGYEQLESFVNFSNAIFRIIRVSSTYTANSATSRVGTPHDRLYADGCRWQPDPNSLQYRSCLDVGKAGGTISNTYRVQILAASGGTQTLNSLIYDFSGSSYHYNSDFTAGARTFTATAAAQSTISKAFSPTSILVTGTSTLTITINNPNGAAVSGYGFSDALPTNVSVAAVPVVTSGCGTPTFTSAPSVPLAVNATTIIGANITVAAGGVCTMQVPVKASATGTHHNTIPVGSFTINDVSTGVGSNQATLTVGNSISGETPTGCAGQRAACWYFPTGFSITTPAACTGGGSPYFATAGLGGGFPTTTSNSNAPSSPGGSSWEQNGGIPSTLAAAISNNDFFRFQFNTNSIPVMTLRWAAERANNGNAPTRMAIYAGGSGTGTGSEGTLVNDFALTTAWVRGSRVVTLAGGLKPTGITEFRFYPYSATSENAGADSFIDDVEFFVCLPPPFTKAFSPSPVNVGQTSRLTFTIRNTNVVDAGVPITPVATNPVLTGVQFTDTLPTGMLIAGTPNVVPTGCGSPTITAAANTGTITVTNATIQPNSTCTIAVNVVTSVAGSLVNTSGAIRSAETGSNTGVDGTATNTLVSIVPPTIEKGFVPSEIPAGGTSRLSLVIQNPNPDHAIRGVAVTDTLPSGVLVADAPNPQRSGCDASSTPTITATADTNSIAVSGASIAAGGTCIVTVSVKAAATGTYNNTIGTGAGNNGLRHVVTGISGDETFYSADGAAATLVVRDATPDIAFIKEVGTSSSGPWFPYLAIPLAEEVNVYYRLTVENVGDVALPEPVGGFVVDPQIAGEEACVWPDSLPVADAFDDDHIASCVVGPIDAVFPGVVNTATASSTVGATTVQAIDSAEYKIANISVVKSVSPTVFTADNQTLTYTIRVENVGSAPLDGWNYGLFPRFTDPRTPDNTESCQAINTVGDLDAIFDPGEVLNCTAQYVTTAADVTAGVVTNTALIEFQQFGRPSNTLNVYYNPNNTSPFLLVNKSMSANPVPGANASYTVTVTNAGSVATTGNLVISDLLPANVTYNTTLGTTGSSGGWACNAPVNEGSNPVRQRMTCTYSGTALAAGGGAGSSTSLVLNVVLGLTASNVSNTATVTGGGDPGCVNPTPAARCSGTVTASTLPVVLGYVESKVEGSLLRVRFGTSVEAGTLGFRVTAGSADPAGQRPLDTRLVEANGFTFKPQQYEVSGPYTGQTEIWIEEITTRGESTRYGPYPVGLVTGNRDQPVLTDWTAIQAEQQAFRSAQLQSLRSVRSGQALEAEVGVRRTGWVRIRHEDLLAQGIDWSGVEASRLALSRGLQPIPLRLEGPAVFGPGSALSFYGDQVEGSLYTDTRVYRLRVKDVGHAEMDRVAAAPVVGVDVQRTARMSYVHAPNTLYHFASVTEDPWVAFTVRRIGVPLGRVTHAFALPNRSATSTAERLVVDLYGAIDMPAAPDHSVRLLLNGQVVAQRQFDGFKREIFSVDLPSGLLQNAANELAVELVADTPSANDVIMVESIRVDYVADLVADASGLSFDAGAGLPAAPTQADSIFGNGFTEAAPAAGACAAGAPGCRVYEVRGVSGAAEPIVLRRRADGRVDQLTGVERDPATGLLRFASASAAGDRYLVVPAAGNVSASLTPAAPVRNPLSGDPASYLIVAHPSFIDGLAPLIAARQAGGYSVRVIDVEDAYRWYTGGIRSAEAVDALIADAHEQLGTRHVLLVGGDTYDYKGYGSSNSISFVPTHYRQTDWVVRYAPADSVYADVDRDGRTDLALGRFPVRTRAELDAVITKTLAYAQAPHGSRLLRVADRDDGGLAFSRLSVGVSGALPGWNETVVDLQQFPVGQTAQARSALVAAVNSGQSLMSFFGHSSPSNWTREGLVTAAQVYGGMFSNAAAPTVVWQLGCYGAYFVDPFANTVAHGLMLQPNGGGAAAVIGASSLTETGSDMTWMSVLGPQLRSTPIGEALREANRTMFWMGGDLVDIRVGGTLLGDPALRLRQ